MTENDKILTATVHAYAKLNLFLNITGREHDGMHTLDNITQSVDIYDTVTVTAEKSDTVLYDIVCNDPSLPLDESNTAVKAALAFLKYSDIKARLTIDITKRIPVMGGMGGSSVDGAAVLGALNYCFKGTLFDYELLALSRNVGSDVPICLLGGTLLSLDKLSDIVPIETDTHCFFVCVRPDFGFDTAKAYAMYDRSHIGSDKNSDTFIDALKGKDGGLIKAAPLLYNIFEQLYGDSRINEIKNALLSHGAKGAAMTGSGSVVYGIFDSHDAAEGAAKILSESYNNTFVCRPVDCGLAVQIGQNGI